MNNSVPMAKISACIPVLPGLHRDASAAQESTIARAARHDKHVSLSRLNHRWPRREAHPEVLQGTAQFYHQITAALLPQPDPILHHATALHATVDMLDAEPAMVQGLVGACLFHRQLLATGVLGGQAALPWGSVQARKPRVCKSRLPAGK